MIRLSIQVMSCITAWLPLLFSISSDFNMAAVEYDTKTVENLELQELEASVLSFLQIIRHFQWNLTKLFSKWIFFLSMESNGISITLLSCVVDIKQVPVDAYIYVCVHNIRRKFCILLVYHPSKCFLYWTVVFNIEWFRIDFLTYFYILKCFSYHQYLLSFLASSNIWQLSVYLKKMYVINSLLYMEKILIKIQR